MKITLIALLLSFSAQLSFAQGKCHSQAIAEAETALNDYPPSANLAAVLAPGVTEKVGPRFEFGPYAQQVELYLSTGSYYSGWFEDVIVFDAATCAHIETVRIYAE